MKVQVIDAAIFIQGMDVEGVTTPKVIDEVKDPPESRLFLEGLISAGKVKVLQPSEESIRAVREAARRTGELNELSEADLEVLALAYEVGGGVLLTDDYNLQNIARTRDGVQNLKRGIKRVIRWNYVCVGCGNRFSEMPPGGGVCPDCGSPVRLIPRRRKKKRRGGKGKG